MDECNLLTYYAGNSQVIYLHKRACLRESFFLLALVL